MSTAASTSLKAKNLKWLALLDVSCWALLSLPASSSGGLATYAAERIARTAGASVAVLLLVNDLPHDVKSMFVELTRRGAAVARSVLSDAPRTSPAG